MPLSADSAESAMAQQVLEESVEKVVVTAHEDD